MSATDQQVELWHSRDKSWLSDVEFNPSNEDLLIVKSMFSLVSLGTEKLLTTQGVSDEIAKNMSVPYMKGDFQGAFTYGYSLVGKVTKGPVNLKNKLVHLMHPHQSILAVRPSDVSVLPDGLDPKLATLASNMETAINAIWDGSIQLGDRVLVIGYGTIGALISLLAKKVTGIEIDIWERDTKKYRAIKEAGHQNYQQNGSNYDVVFNTSSSEEMLQQAIKLTRQEGKIVEVSWYGNREIKLNLGTDFHYGRKQIICSQVSHIPYEKQPVWDYKKRKDLVFKLLKDMQPKDLIDLEVPFAEAPHFFDKLRKGTVDNLGIVFKY